MATVDSKSSDRTAGVQVISRAAGILRVLSTETGGMSLGQIAERVKLPRSTVQRIVYALADEGLVAMAGRDGGITLGPEIQILASASNLPIRDRIRPVMKAISDKAGETVDLAVLDVDRMRFIDQIVGSQRLRTVSSIGETFPLTTTANGKAALACLSELDAKTLIDNEFVGMRSIVKRKKQLNEELNKIRAGALATDEDEHTEGVSALGFAIRDTSGDVYAVSTPVPSSRYAHVKKELSETLMSFRQQLLVELNQV